MIRRRIRALWVLLGRTERQRQRAKDAVRKVAEREGDVACEKYLVEHYRYEAEKTNPFDRWWEYAELRQHHEDHKVELTVARRRLDSSKAYATAQKLKLEKMQ